MRDRAEDHPGAKNDRAGEVFARWLALSLAVAAVRGSSTAYDEALIHVAGRTGARVLAFGAVREATWLIVDRIPALGDGVGFNRESLIEGLQADLDALELAHPGLTVRAAR